MLFVIRVEPVSSPIFGPPNFAALMAATVAAVLAGLMLPFFYSLLRDGLGLAARGKDPRGLVAGALAVGAVVKAMALLLVFAGSAGSSSSAIFGSTTAIPAPWPVARLSWRSLSDRRLKPSGAAYEADV